MPSVWIAGRNFQHLIENGSVDVLSFAESPSDGGTTATFVVVDPSTFERTALQDVKKFRVTLLDSMGFAPESAESIELTNERTRRVTLSWTHTRNAEGKVLPKSFDSLWVLKSGKASAIHSEIIDYDAAPDLKPNDFTLSAFNLPEPPEPKPPGSYRTDPWLYYFFGGVLCVAVGAFFIHRVTRKSERA
jgi:hypothetical protein